MKTKCLIVDDEPLAVEVIVSHIGKIDSLEVAGTCQNAFEAFNFLKSNKVDLMFLDIHMPEIKGTQLVKNLSSLPKIIFTTAYREYALEGFDLNALDYLLKPISFERFMQAIDKYDAVKGNKNNTVFIPEQDQTLAKAEIIHVREKNNIHRIKLDEIQYIESVGDYVHFHLNVQTITVRTTLSSIEAQLPASQFLRVHRSFIVALKYISSFSAVEVKIGNTELPIGTTYRSQVHKVLDFGGL